MKQCVLQDWVQDLTLMQQTVLLTALRGPDGIRKDHVVKVLLRWYRRCVLRSAFDGGVFTTPFDEGGGSFMGPLKENTDLNMYVDLYSRHIDEMPHHFQLHLMHAAEILGYKHPHDQTRDWWNSVYIFIVEDAHLNPETEEQLDRRLSDNFDAWSESERCKAL